MAILVESSEVSVVGVDVEAAWEDEGVELMDLMPKQDDGIG